VIHTFVADHSEGEPVPSEETPEVAWFTEDDLRERIEHPVNLDRFEELLSFQGDTRFYSYTTGPYRKIV
jgi:8-oxo-dGTP diphosphatase